MKGSISCFEVFCSVLFLFGWWLVSNICSQLWPNIFSILYTSSRCYNTIAFLSDFDLITKLPVIDKKKKENESTKNCSSSILQDIKTWRFEIS